MTSRRSDPLLWTDVVNPSSEALAALRRLGRDSGTDENLLADLVGLHRSLTEVVPSFLGLQLRVDLGADPVVLTTLTAGDTSAVVTSLRWPQPDGQGSRASLVIYAGRRGALVDLAADIAWTAPAGVTTEVELDGHLPDGRLTPGLVGLDQLALVSRAEGFLIEDGVDPRRALAELTRQATAAGTDLLSHARAVVGGRPEPR